jgi:hypothetical protein
MGIQSVQQSFGLASQNGNAGIAGFRYSDLTEFKLQNGTFAGFTRIVCAQPGAIKFLITGVCFEKISNSPGAVFGTAGCMR